MSDPQNIYDNREFFEGYTHLRDTGAGLNEVVEQPALMSLLPSSLEGLRVLDVGCGFGNFARKAKALGAASVLGIDISERMLALARERSSDAGVEYRRLSIEELGTMQGVFDLAVSSLALHYVADYRAAVAGIAGRLTRRGRFVFSVEHPILTSRAEQAWVRDNEGRVLYWPVDEYFSEGARHTHWFIENVVKYHRTVETYVEGLIEAGFTLEGLKEPQPVIRTSETISDLDLEWRRPAFLVMAARWSG